MRLQQNEIITPYVLGEQEVTANLYCNFADPNNWEGCVICSIYLRVTTGSPSMAGPG